MRRLRRARVFFEMGGERSGPRSGKLDGLAGSGGVEAGAHDELGF